MDARRNSEWIPLCRTAVRMGAATNQAPEEEYRVVRNGRISARNSAPRSERVPKMRKRPVGTCCPDWPCECWGDWIRTSDLLNSIQEASRVNIAEKTSLSWLTALYVLDFLQEFGHFSSFSLPISALDEQTA